MSYGFRSEDDGYWYTNNGEALFCLKMVKFLGYANAGDIVTYSSKINYRTSRFKKDFYEAIAVIEDPHYSTYFKYISKNRYNLEQTIKKETEKIFREQIATRETKDDFGLDDEFTYAYIMAHTDIAKHHQLRFIDWKNNEYKLTDRFANIGTLYKSLGLDKIKGSAEYVVMLISSGEHISTIC